MPTAAKKSRSTQSEPKHITRWRKMKFGLMMHWGLYSAAGGVWKDKNIEGYNEQIMHRAKIAWPDYLSLCSGFTAAKWDPEFIAKLAAEAGMNYVVITSKHHDGFNIWHTRLSDFNVVDAAAAKRDVLKELTDACARRKINFGLYYSLIDWHYPGARPMSDHNSDPITPALEDYSVGQLRELLTDYGPICEVWFDMSKPTISQSQKFANLVHSLQPDCMISGRIWNGQDDFMECGDNETPDYWFDGPWESSVTMFHDTWGYRSWQVRDTVEVKVREKVRDLAFVTARGGNYLLNIGPRGDGSIHEFDADVLRGIGGWMKIHGEAIYESDPQPRLNLDFGYATGRPGRLYLYISKPPADGMLRVPGWVAAKSKAHVLKKGRKLNLTCMIREGALEIQLPKEGLDPYLAVVAVDYQGQIPYIPQSTIKVDGGPVELTASSSLPWHRMVGQDYYSNRKFLSGREWLVMSQKTKEWKVVARREAGGASTGFFLTVDGAQTQFILPEDTKPQSQVIARIKLAKGKMTTLKLGAIASGCELKDQGLVLELA